jgi:hypothetical protein
LNISERTVTRIRTEENCNIGPKHNRMTDAEKSKAATMLEDGASYAEVARSLGRWVETIRSNFPGMGWTPEQVGEYLALNRRYPHLTADLTA